MGDKRRWKKITEEMFPPQRNVDIYNVLDRELVQAKKKKKLRPSWIGTDLRDGTVRTPPILFVTTR